MIMLSMLALSRPMIFGLIVYGFFHLVVMVSKSIGLGLWAVKRHQINEAHKVR